MPPALSPKQLDFLTRSYHSFNVASGAVSSGKTFVQTLRWFKHLYDVPDGVLLMMSGKTSESLYDNVIRDLERLNPSDILFSRSPLRGHVKSKGIDIACADAHNEVSWGRIQGKTVYGWLADEVTQHPNNFVKMAQSRCRGEGKIWPKFWTCNPDVPEHFVKREYLDNEELDLRTWQFTLDDNPVLSDEYIDELKASYSGIYYDRYIRGLWVHAEGMVYDEWDPGIHIVDDFDPPPDWFRIRAIDFGYTNPFVCLWGALDEDDRLWIYDEHYEARQLIEYHAERILERRMYLRHATVADHDAQDAAELAAKKVYTTPAQKDVEWGIQRVKARLQRSGDGRPRLMVSRRCRNLIRELPLYRWAPAREGQDEKEVPIKADDHALDALRYMVAHVETMAGAPGKQASKRKPVTAGMRDMRF